MGVMTVVESCLHHLDIVLCYLWLLGEFIAKEVGNKLKVAIEEPAYNSKGKHIAALQHRLVVHATVGKAVLNHCCQRALHYAIRVNTHLAEIILTLELGLLQVFRTETVSVDDNSGLRLGILVLSLERCGIHSHQHITLVTWREHLSRTNVHLESRHTSERALRGADVCRIIRESRNSITHSG